jgi:hypothetical protein
MFVLEIAGGGELNIHNLLLHFYRMWFFQEMRGYPTGE